MAKTAYTRGRGKVLATHTMVIAEPNQKALNDTIWEYADSIH